MSVRKTKLLQRSLPGSVWLWGGGFFLITSAMFAVFYFNPRFSEVKELRNHGVRTDGIVTDKNRYNYSKSPTKYTLNYRFYTTNRNQVTMHDVEVNQGVWEKYVASSSIPVTYLIKEPSTNRPTEQLGKTDPAVVRITWGALAIGILILLAAVGLRMKRSRTRQ